MLHVAMPLLAFDAHDAELWRDDPAEFVRKVGAGLVGVGWMLIEGQSVGAVGGSSAVCAF